MHEHMERVSSCLSSSLKNCEASAGSPPHHWCGFVTVTKRYEPNCHTSHIFPHAHVTLQPSSLVLAFPTVWFPPCLISFLCLQIRPASWNRTFTPALSTNWLSFFDCSLNKVDRIAKEKEKTKRTGAHFFPMQVLYCVPHRSSL